MKKALALGLLAALWSGAAAAQDEMTDVDSLIVLHNRPTSVGKLDAPLRDQPITVTLIPEETLDTLGRARLEDIGYLTVGVIPTLPRLGVASGGFFVRGFNSAPVIIDGYYAYVNAFGSSGVQDLATVESVEILRGPASLLYGQGNPGGVINLATKRPQPINGGRLEATADEHGGLRGEFDITGPLAGEALTGRLIGVLEDSETFRDFVTVDRALIAPSLTASLGPVTLRGAYVRDDLEFVPDNGPGFNPELIANLPVERNLAEPWLPHARSIVEDFRLEADWRLSETWTARAAYFRRDLRDDGGYMEIDPDVTLSGTTVDRYLYRYPDLGKDSAEAGMASAQLLGRFSTGGLDHVLTIAADYLDQRTYYSYEAYELAEIDYADPTYQAAQPPLGTLLFDGRGAFVTFAKAAYIQDLISFGPHWKALVGVRKDEIVTKGYAELDETGLFSTSDESKVTPRLGVVFDATDRLTLYGSYSEAFVPLVGDDRFGNLFKPEESRAYEVGLRRWLGEQLLLSAAVYDIKKENIIVVDPADDEHNINAGVARSQGAEIELNGRLAPNWRVGAGLAYNDARITESVDPLYFPEGDTLPAAAKWMAMLNTRYRFEGGALSGLSVGGNVAYASERPYMIPNRTPELEAYTRIDVFAAYPVGPVEVQLNINNLTDERILLANGYGRVHFDQPRTAHLTLRYAWGGLRR